MIKEISAEQLKTQMNSGKDLVILDVRRDDEREVHHIPNSLHIPLQELEMRIDELEPYKDKEIVVYCRSGSRSSNACMFLQMMGYKNAVNLRGGMMNW